jgi:hypothetical protein
MLGELDEDDVVRIIKKISKGLKDDKVEQSWESCTRGFICWTAMWVIYQSYELLSKKTFLYALKLDLKYKLWALCS